MNLGRFYGRKTHDLVVHPTAFGRTKLVVAMGNRGQCCVKTSSATQKLNAFDVHYPGLFLHLFRHLDQFSKQLIGGVALQTIGAEPRFIAAEIEVLGCW